MITRTSSTLDALGRSVDNLSLDAEVRIDSFEFSLILIVLGRFQDWWLGMVFGSSVGEGCVGLESEL